MRYVLAIVLPPVAFFTIGKPIQGILNLILMERGAGTGVPGPAA